MPDAESVVRAAYAAYARGDLNTMLDAVDADVEWTFLDYSVDDPQPDVCHVLGELEKTLHRQQSRGLRLELDEVIGYGDRVVVVMSVPGIDEFRAVPSDERTFHVVTTRGDKIVALRACRDRAAAIAAAQ